MDTIKELNDSILAQITREELEEGDAWPVNNVKYSITTWGKDNADARIRQDTPLPMVTT